ncbi:MAG TPA: RNA 2',3'-cyclic phosphodiesterase [Candidatus Cloacimonadota bacterium]|nr:RNA 2',3'-cyclic phosphodiesterase [Candidatus Cloacimonadota bacterium]
MRLFVALEVPQVLKEELIRILEGLKRLSPGGINWVTPDNLHLTLNFIGEAPDHLLKEIQQAISLEAAKLSAANLQAEGFELFPAKYPRLLWLKLSGEDRALQSFNRNLLKALRTLDLDADAKALKLHITLGRIKAPQKPDFERAVLAHPITHDVLSWDTISLYRSALRPQGPIYTQLQQYNLS